MDHLAVNLTFTCLGYLLLLLAMEYFLRKNDKNDEDSRWSGTE